MANGYAIKEGDEYYLSLRFLEHGKYVRNRKNAYRTAKSYTKRLAEETDYRVEFTIEENGRGIYMYTSSGKHAVWTYSTIGKRFYLHQAAAGKAILSRSSRTFVEEIIDRWGFPSATEDTVTNAKTLFYQPEAIRESRISFNYEEQLEGIKAVGIPVNRSDGRVIEALSIASSPKRLTDEQFEEDIPDVLFGVANEFELKLSLP